MLRLVGVNAVGAVIVDETIFIGQKPYCVVVHLLTELIAIFAALDRISGFRVDDDVIPPFFGVVAEERIVKYVVRKAEAESHAGIRCYR